MPFQPLRVGEWWDADSRNQIDVVALGAEGDLLLGECKWGRVRAQEVERLQARADLIVKELAGVRRVHLAVFSARGLAPEVQAEVDAGRLWHVPAERLFSD